MKKFLCVILCLLLNINLALATEVTRLYLINNASRQEIKTTFNPAFNKAGFNLINDDEYMIYENPVQDIFNVIILKQSGQDSYYYYLSNSNSDFSKTLLTYLDKKGYKYKRIKNNAFLDLFYNDATSYLSQSRSSIKTVSDDHSSQSLSNDYDEYDFSDEAQERFDNQGKIVNNPSPQISQQPDILTGSVIQLEEGSQFNAVLSSGISSESISNNDRISAQLMQDWIFNGIIIAPAGSIINGTVIDSRPATFAMGNGRIGINFNQMITPDGKMINLATNKVYIVGDSPRALKIAGRVAGGILGGVAIAAVSMLMGCDAKALIGGAAVGGALGTLSAISTKGEDIDIPEGTPLQIMLSEPMTIQPYTSL